MNLSKKDFILALSMAGQDELQAQGDLINHAAMLAGVFQFASPEEKAELLDWLLKGVETTLAQLPEVHAKLLEERANVGL